MIPFLPFSLTLFTKHFLDIVEGLRSKNLHPLDPDLRGQEFS